MYQCNLHQWYMNMILRLTVSRIHHGKTGYGIEIRVANEVLEEKVLKYKRKLADIQKETRDALRNDDGEVEKGIVNAGKELNTYYQQINEERKENHLLKKEFKEMKTDIQTMDENMYRIQSNNAKQVYEDLKQQLRSLRAMDQEEAERYKDNEYLLEELEQHEDMFKRYQIEIHRLEQLLRQKHEEDPSELDYEELSVPLADEDASFMGSPGRVTE